MTHYSLRHMDLEMMRRLHRKVNIVVVIAKADSLTAAEVKRLKTRILNDLEEHQIQVRTTPSLDFFNDFFNLGLVVSNAAVKHELVGKFPGRA